MPFSAKAECAYGSDGHPAPGPALPSPFDEILLDEVRNTLGATRLSQLLQLLAAELETKPRTITEAVADSDLHRAAHEAHSLKGAAACLGAQAVAKAAQELEEVIVMSLNYRQRVVPSALHRMSGAVALTQAALAQLPRDLNQQVLRS